MRSVRYPNKRLPAASILSASPDCNSDDLSEDPWAPSMSAHGFKLASWSIQNTVSKAQINEYFTNSLGNSALAGDNSMHTLENQLRILDPYSEYLQWFEGQVEDGSRTVPFFYHNVLDFVRFLLPRSHTEMN